MEHFVFGKTPIVHIGILVENIEKTAAAYADFLKVPVPEISITDSYAKSKTTYRGAPTEGRVRQTNFQIGPNLLVELLEPTKEPSEWRAALDANGEGFHHIALEVENLEDLQDGFYVINWKYRTNRRNDNIQEWPTAWDSHLQQPYAIMEETIRLNTLRLRNSPALAMWGAGNESPNPFGDEIDMMGRYSIELDGTRPFHRGEGWGGSTHNYQCWWGREALDFNTTLTSDFFGEFGLACVPCYESIARYLPEEELSCPPPHAGEVFTYHTPIFETADDISRLTQYAGYFLPETYDMRQFIFASQLSQATGIRHTLERARVRWPDCAGALYYKMNDNFPAASWACVDWYGAPKIGHYIFQDAFAPLHACVLPKTLNMRGTPTTFEVFLLDDADALAGSNWEVRIAAFDKTLKSIWEASFTGTGSLAAPAAVGELMLKYSETDTCPLLLTTEVWKDGVLADRTFYWFNFESEKGCLFKLPKTTLTISTEGKAVTVRNTGMLPAVGVELSRPGYADQFTVSDNVFWLNAGESKIVSVNCADGITVSAWNAE